MVEQRNVRANIMDFVILHQEAYVLYSLNGWLIQPRQRGVVFTGHRDQLVIGDMDLDYVPYLLKDLIQRRRDGLFTVFAMDV